MEVIDDRRFSEEHFPVIGAARGHHSCLKNALFSSSAGTACWHVSTYFRPNHTYIRDGHFGISTIHEKNKPSSHSFFVLLIVTA